MNKLKKLVLVLALSLAGCLPTLPRESVDPIPPDPPMSELLQVYRLETSTGVTFTGQTGLDANTHDATALELRDGSDLTYDSEHAEGDGVQQGNAMKRSAWTAVLTQSVAPIQSIDFVRVTVRAMVTPNNGSTAVIYMYYDGSRLTHVAPGDDYLLPPPDAFSFNDKYYDYLTNLITGLPWTPSDVSILVAPHVWEFEELCETFTEFDANDMRISDVKIEVWGVRTPSVRLGGYTSYDVGRFDTGGPEAQRTPEEAAAVWRGDRRHMRQE